MVSLLKLTPIKIAKDLYDCTYYAGPVTVLVVSLDGRDNNLDDSWVVRRSIANTTPPPTPSGISSSNNNNNNKSSSSSPPLIPDSAVSSTNLFLYV